MLEVEHAGPDVVRPVGLGAGLHAAVILVHTHNAAEDAAWTAIYRYRGETKRLEAALEAYGSTSARPYMLLRLARAAADPPTDEEGRRKAEPSAERRERLGRAEASLRSLVGEYPKHYLRLYALSLLGLVLEEQGRYLEAVDTLKEALDAAPGTLEPKLHFDIGRNYVLSGDPESARRYLERAAESTRMVTEPPMQEGMPARRVKPVWRENAEYLLARIGPGERAIRLPKPGEKPEPAAEEPERQEETKPGVEPQEEPEQPAAKPGQEEEPEPEERPDEPEGAGREEAREPAAKETGAEAPAEPAAGQTQEPAPEDRPDPGQ